MSFKRMETTMSNLAAQPTITMDNLLGLFLDAISDAAVHNGMPDSAGLSDFSFSSDRDVLIRTQGFLSQFLAVLSLQGLNAEGSTLSPQIKGRIAKLEEQAKEKNAVLTGLTGELQSEMNKEQELQELQAKIDQVNTRLAAKKAEKEKKRSELDQNEEAMGALAAEVEALQQKRQAYQSEFAAISTVGGSLSKSLTSEDGLCDPVILQGVQKTLSTPDEVRGWFGGADTALRAILDNYTTVISAVLKAKEGIRKKEGATS